MKKLIATTVVLGLIHGAAFAGKKGLGAIPSITHHGKECFYAGETSFDIISIYVDPRGSSNVSGELEAGAGGGLALSHFFNENFGLMGRAYWWDGDDVVHSFTGSVVIRYPFQDLCLAPYVFGGIGGHFDSDSQVSGHAGAGLEYRFTDRLGLVADYSYTWTDETEDWHLYTLGLRIKF